ncbi:hypothetical protein IW261DRAFT_1423161 [Armillaria novae-zelandiae]|uniref:Uncharacterized protein n=1 Tax=Armillaria novae-zelandiae TaxID=153914 RepID=A0AA39NZA4_9AGAR|nr:hypothetical protein IW261DRAFT_1423161 [Armillaria novae-zelandiae]
MSSRSPSKRKLVHLSPIPASIETTPEPSSQARPRGRPMLKRKVSYGELSAEEVESVVAPSDVDDADLSANSLKRRGRVLFVDDEASEASHVSEEPSADEDDYGSDCEAGYICSVMLPVKLHLLSSLRSEDGAVVPSLCSLSKVKTVKGSYVDALLRSGNVDDVAESDNVKNDPTLTASQGESVHTAGDAVADSSDEQTELHTHANPVTPIQSKPSPSKSVAGVKPTVASTVGRGSAKVGASKTSSAKASTRTSTTSCPRSKATVASKKDVEPAFSSDNPDDDSTPAAAPASQITSELAALLGDDVRGSSPEPDDAGPVLCLPEIGVAPYKPGPDLSEPDDPALRVMQPELMEEHLVALGVYVSLLPLGVYRAVVSMGFAPDTFDPPRFGSFTDMAKLFYLESLTSLVEAFKFERYGSFINLARAMPSALSLEGKTLHVSGSNAVCMTVGLVTECMLFEPAQQGGYMFRRESMAWALAFNLEFVETTCISNRDTSACASPAKGQWRSSTKTLTTELVSPGAGYPTSMGFLDEGCLEKFSTTVLPIWLAGLPVFNRRCIVSLLWPFVAMELCLVDTPFNDALEDAILADIEAYTEGLEAFEFLDEINSGKLLFRLLSSFCKHHYYLYMDRFVSLCPLPMAWQLSPNAAEYQCVASRIQIAVLSFVVRSALTDIVHSMTFSNWHFTPYCFFLHAFTSVDTVRFISEPGTPATTSHIPYPYLLPGSIRRLIIHGCSLYGHSVEGLLSSSSNASLESLELDSLEYGSMYIPSNPSPLERDTWRVLTGLDGFRKSSIVAGPLPTLRDVCLDLSYNAIRRVLSPTDPLTSLEGARDLLFDVRFSLQTLVLHYLYTSLKYWHNSVQSTFSWHALTKTLVSSVLRLVVRYEGNDLALCYKLRREHFKQLLLDAASYPGQVAPLGGELYVRLIPYGQDSFDLQEYEAINTLLGSVAHNRGVQATIYPVQIEYGGDAVSDMATIS